MIGDLVKRIKRLPPIVVLRRLRHQREFWRAKDVRHFGVYASFDEALDAIPEGLTVGWDNSEAASMSVASTERINARDYPVLFWMRQLWDGPVTVFDYGGNTGSKRYAFEQYLPFDSDKHWIVCDVQAVIEQGRRLAQAREPLNLSFTTDFAEADTASLLLCLGVLQFVEEPLGETLQGLKRLPPHLIVNGLPVHHERAFVTLVNNDGRGFCPYRVFARREFVSSLESSGYQLVDEWENNDKGCWIPVHDGHGLSHYSGFYFRRD